MSVSLGLAWTTCQDPVSREGGRKGGKKERGKGKKKRCRERQRKRGREDWTGVCIVLQQMPLSTSLSYCSVPYPTEDL